MAPPVMPPADAYPVVPTLVWAGCGNGFECATAVVPLDYEAPERETIEIALVRLPASDASNRIGSLFINPGGPGASGVDMVFANARTFPSLLRQRFDLVGFDPRGIARSTPLQCFDTFAQAVASRPVVPFPTTAEEEVVRKRADLALAAACGRRSPAILHHMSTANVARDLDRLRQAVGDDDLHYLGFSYGSYLGVTYAHLFPNRVGSVVVDGVLDPLAWSAGRGDADHVPFSTRLRSDAGAMATLREFFRLCEEAAGRCAFSGDVAGRFAALAERLRSGGSVEVSIPPGPPVTFTYAVLISRTRAALYNPTVWPAHAALLAAVEKAAAAPINDEEPINVEEPIDARLLSPFAPPAPPNYRNAVEGFPAVACADSNNPASFSAWSAAAVAAEDEFGYFGPAWTWVSSPCAVWPGRDNDRYMGPWGVETAAPVLVVGGLFDPATPYEGAVVVADLLPNSRLLTYAGWGHVSFSRSGCAEQAITHYLVTGGLPDEGKVCPPAASPFGPPAGAAFEAQGTRLEPSFRTVAPGSEPTW